MENVLRILLLICMVILSLALFRVYNINYDNINVLNSTVYIAESRYGGRGVFANRNIRKNEIVEIAPYIQTPHETVKGTFLDYVFSKNKYDSVLCFGNISMINHSDDPNVYITIGDENATITAYCDIQKDQELLISYGPKYWSSRDLQKVV